MERGMFCGVNIWLGCEAVAWVSLWVRCGGAILEDGVFLESSFKCHHVDKCTIVTMWNSDVVCITSSLYALLPSLMLLMMCNHLLQIWEALSSTAMRVTRITKVAFTWLSVEATKVLYMKTLQECRRTTCCALFLANLDMSTVWTLFCQ